MGQPFIARDVFDNDSSVITLGLRGSGQSVDELKSVPELGSAIQLFQCEPSPEEQKWQHGVRDWLVFICIIILAMMDAFDATVLVPALPGMANTFETSLAYTLWANTAYLILNAASQLYFTMFCEVFSSGPVWIIAVVLSTVGTGVCCGSMGVVELIIGRLIQGIGGGGAMSLCFVIMAESAPEFVHPRYSCYILLTRMVGAILGPVVGGLFVDFASWTWAFYFSFVFCALGLLVIPFAVDLRASRHIPFRKLRILDWSGTTLALLGSGGILVGLSRAGANSRWDQWQVLAPIAVGAAIIAALVFYESKWALHPVFSARVLRSRSMAMIYLGCFLHGFVAFCHLQFFPFYLMSVKYFSTTLSGISLLAMSGLAITPAAVVGLTLANDRHNSKYVISGGWVLILLAAGCSILLDATTPTVGWVFLFFTAGLGHGLLLSSYNISVWHAPRAEGVWSSVRPTTLALSMRSWGMAVAVPLGGMIFVNFFGNELRNMGLDRNFVNTAHGYLILMDQVHMSDVHRQTIKAASVGAFRVVWEVTTGVAALGTISSAFLWKNKL